MMMRLIQEGRFEFRREQWDSITSECKELVMICLLKLCVKQSSDRELGRFRIFFDILGFMFSGISFIDGWYGKKNNGCWGSLAPLDGRSWGSRCYWTKKDSSKDQNFELFLLCFYRKVTSVASFAMLLYGCDFLFVYLITGLCTDWFYLQTNLGNSLKLLIEMLLKNDHSETGR